MTVALVVFAVVCGLAAIVWQTPVLVAAGIFALVAALVVDGTRHHDDVQPGYPAERWPRRDA